MPNLCCKILLLHFSTFLKCKKALHCIISVSSVGVGSVLGVFFATVAIHYYNIRYAFLIPGSIALLAFTAFFSFPSSTSKAYCPF